LIFKKIDSFLILKKFTLFSLADNSSTNLTKEFKVKMFVLLVSALSVFNCYAIEEKIVDCSEGRFHVIVTQNEEVYNYIAFDKAQSEITPSLVLRNGTSDFGKHSENFIFKNGNYTYLVNKAFPGAGSGVKLIVFKNDKEIFQETCQSSSYYMSLKY